MIKKIFFIVLYSAISLGLHAQTDILQAIGIHHNIEPARFLEYGDYYYFIQQVKTSDPNLQTAYDIVKANKYSYQVAAITHLEGDTSSSNPPSKYFFHEIYGNKIHVVFTRYGAPAKEMYMQLDTSLNITIPPQELINTSTGFFQALNFSRIEHILYLTIQAAASAPGQWENRIVQVDLAGNVKRIDVFSPAFPNLPYSVKDVLKKNDSTYLLSGQGLIDGGDGFMITDTNFNVLDTFYEGGYDSAQSYYNVSPYFVIRQIPTGSIFGSCITTSGSSNNSYATLMKFNPQNRYRPSIFKRYGGVDSLDNSHSSGGYYLLQYQPVDNFIYAASSTHSNDWSGQCLASYNYLQVVCSDTNLNLKFRKFIRSDSGCAFSYSLSPCYDRSGVLLVAVNSIHKNIVFRIDSNATVGISEPGGFTVRDRIIVYPNPATDRIHIDDVLNGLSEIMLYDAMGRLVINEPASGNKHTMLLADLPAGLYVLRVRTKDDEVYTQKIMKE